MNLSNTAARDRAQYGQPSAEPVEAAWVAANAARLSETLREIFFDTRVVVDADAVHGVVTNFISTHPEDPPTHRRLVAVHEAGHVVAFEATGALFHRAEVKRIDRRSDNWIGEAFSCDPPPLMPRWITSDGALCDAVSTLAGPIAEEMYGGGVVEASPWEVLHSRACVTRAASLSAKQDRRRWGCVLKLTVALVECNARNIADIADLLMRKERIRRCDRVAQKILSRVTIPAPPHISVGGRAIVERLSKVPPFLSKVRRK